MLSGLGDYGSGSESENETERVQLPAKPKLASKPPAKSSSLALPPPSADKASAPKARKPKKIAIGLPSLSSLPQDDDNDDLKDDRPPAKKPRLEAGAGASSLLSMLPTPKRKVPVASAPERVLGGGRGPGLVFNTAPTTAPVSTSKEPEDEEQVEAQELESTPWEDIPTPAPVSFMPMSISKRRPNISVEEEGRRPAAPSRPSAAPAVDFFGLGTSSSSSSTKVTAGSASSASHVSITSAPEVVEFKPPTPTPQDPYPGYYLLPSGAWAAYDPDYYNVFLKKWKKEYDDQVRALEKGAIKGFEGSEESAEEVNMVKEMEKARKEIQERESRKAVTTDATGEPAKPRMNIDPAKQSGRAKSRHQLSSLLTDAYQNRAALEEKIAEGRRNRKEAGNKYGF
ncbi:Proline-rich protein PRCC [Pleurotus pulmonarius]